MKRAVRAALVAVLFVGWAADCGGKSAVPGGNDADASGGGGDSAGITSSSGGSSTSSSSGAGTSSSQCGGYNCDDGGSSSGTGASSSGGGDLNPDAGPMPCVQHGSGTLCDDCLGQSCCDVIQACETDKACATFWTCLSNCQWALTRDFFSCSQSPCGQSVQPNAQTAALLGCAKDKCATICGKD